MRTIHLARIPQAAALQRRQPGPAQGLHLDLQSGKEFVKVDINLEPDAGQTGRTLVDQRGAGSVHETPTL
jgi:hypothetical protein